MKIVQQISLLLCSLWIISPSFSQGGTLDGEIGFQYVKAEYLFETNRFDECIQEYNQVILKNPGYKDALVKRATAKYNLAAYKGAKQDVIQFIEINGITAQAAFILGKTENAMGNDVSAIQSISAAIGLADQSEYYELRATLYEKNGELLKACEDFQEAAALGSALGQQKNKSLCGGGKTKTSPQVIKPNNPANTVPTNNEPANDQGNTTVPDTNQPTENESNPTDINSDPYAQGYDDPTIPKEDDFAQSVVIDEELSIDIYGQGLGRRSITATPSILIIADESGSVTLDICVNNLGEVTKAEFNVTMSTIAKKSMVNLALRKAKEFVFEKSVYTNQCGYMVFKIKAN